MLSMTTEDLSVTISFSICLATGPANTQAMCNRVHVSLSSFGIVNEV